jgi:hypothetical protein
MKNFVPILKKIGMHLLKKITTDVIMNEKPKSQLTYLLDKENQTNQTEQKLQNIIKEATKPRKILDITNQLPLKNDCSNTVVSSMRELSSGVVVGSMREPSYMQYLIETNQINQVSNTIRPSWQQHINRVQQQGVDNDLGIYASNFRFNNNEEQKEQSR